MRHPRGRHRWEGTSRDLTLQWDQEKNGNRSGADCVHPSILKACGVLHIPSPAAGLSFLSSTLKFLRGSRLWRAEWLCRSHHSSCTWSRGKIVMGWEGEAAGTRCCSCQHSKSREGKGPFSHQPSKPISPDGGLNTAKLRNQTWLRHLVRNDLSGGILKFKTCCCAADGGFKKIIITVVVVGFFPFCLVFRIGFCLA